MALPVFQAAGVAVLNETGANISPAWPAHQAGDVGFLMVEGREIPQIVAEAGFKEVPFSPQMDRIGTTNYHHSRLFWKRATGNAEPAPTVMAPGDHCRAKIVTFRGCTSSGLPWNVAAASNTGGTGSSTVTFPGVTTTHADVLIANFAMYGISTAGSTSSGEANASLANLTERVDDPTTLNSSVFLLITGSKAVAGAVSSTTSTLTAAVVQSRYTIALTGEPTAAEDGAPRPLNWGVPVESISAAVSPAWPAHAAGDIGFLLVESGGWPVSLTTAAGFVEVDSSPQNSGVSGAASAASLKVYWKRATGAAEPAPTVGFVADHIRAAIVTVRGAIATGNPWGVSAGNVEGANTANVSLPGLTTLSANNLILQMLGTSADTSTLRLTGLANTSVDTLNKFVDYPSSIGSGSSFSIVSSKKLTVGTVNATTGTLNTSTLQAKITLAIKPPPGQSGEPLEKITYTLTLRAITLRINRKIIAERIQYAFTLRDVTFRITAGYVITMQGLNYTSQMNSVIFRKVLGRWERQDARAEGVWTKELPLED